MIVKGYRKDTERIHISCILRMKEEEGQYTGGGENYGNENIDRGGRPASCGSGK